MDYAIRHLTKLWKEQLTIDEEFITPEDLERAGLPPQLRRQMEILVTRQLRDSMPAPATEWADLDHEEIRAAWKHLLSSASDHIRCPASYLPAVLETAISELLEVLLQPRVAIPQVLFGRKERLGLEPLRTAAGDIAVNDHLSYALIRYMELKEMGEITRGECADLIARIDGKLVERSSDADLVDLLHPLFDLYGGEADPSLLSIFFEEKGRDDIAHELDRLRSPLDAEQLLNLLRSGHILHAAEGSIMVTFAEADGHPSPEKDEREPGHWHEPGHAPEFAPEPENSPELAHEPAPELVPEHSHEPEPDLSPEHSPEPLAQSSEDAAADDDDAMPFWKRFMDAETAEQDEPAVADGIVNAFESNIADAPGAATPSAATPSAAFADLDHRLALDRQRFIDEIFSGSEDGYEQALEDLSGMDDWRQAASYIQTEIFGRNMINMYSETAIDLTDQLQSYFQDMRRSG